MDGSPAPDVTLERLHEIADAFARRDVEGIVNSFAEDGEFRNARGPHYWGESFKGKAAILTIALTLEVLFLGLSLAIELTQRGLTAVRATLATAAVSTAIAVGAIGSAALLGGASHAVLAAVLAFGAAALLYLVTEELLVEAHEATETSVLTAMFFVGFLAIFILEGLS